jgi:hypothetical protein
MAVRRALFLTIAAAVAALPCLPMRAQAVGTASSGVSAGPLHWDPSNPVTRSYYIPTVTPGSTFTDQMRVQNDNDAAVDVYVDPVDGLTAAPSGAVYANRTDPVRRWGGWVTPAVSHLSLPAHSETQVPFTVRVPVGASPGDHLAGIAFENAHPVPGHGTISITSVIRTVVGILVKVPGPAAFHLRIYGVTLQPITSLKMSSAVIDMVDDGLLLGHPQLTLTVSGPGHPAKTLTRTLDTLLPGDRISYPWPWSDDLQPGSYAVSVDATAPGMAPVHYQGTYQLATTLRGVPGSASIPKPAAATASSTPSWVIPVVALAGVLLVLLLGLTGFMFLLLRRRRDGGVAERPVGAASESPHPH